jgi:hypothetical protein
MIYLELNFIISTVFVNLNLNFITDECEERQSKYILSLVTMKITISEQTQPHAYLSVCLVVRHNAT